MCDPKTTSLVDDEDELSVSDDSEPEERPCMASFDPILDHSDEDDDEEAVHAPAGLGDQSQFSLKGGGMAFSHRSHRIFDCLDSLAKPSSSSSSSVNQQKDGVFARPQAPPPCRKTSQPPLSPPNPPKKRGAPDYLVHPERWTHYSLEDVSETSDQGNARAALSFLSTLKERKEEVKKEQDELEGSDSSPSDLQRKMIYNKPSRLKTEQPAARNRKKEMLLSHLQDEDGGKDEEGKETLETGGRRAEVEEKQTVDQTEEERERGEGESHTVFTSFRKMNTKNYRRSAAKEEHQTDSCL